MTNWFIDWIWLVNPFRVILYGEVKESLSLYANVNHIYQPLRSSLTGLNSEFSFSLTSCLTKAEEPSLSYYLSVAGGRIFRFIPFPRVLVLCEMQSVSSRIWIRVAVSISYNDNHYTTGTSLYANVNVFSLKCFYSFLIVDYSIEYDCFFIDLFDP